MKLLTPLLKVGSGTAIVGALVVALPHVSHGTGLIWEGTREIFGAIGDVGDALPPEARGILMCLGMLFLFLIPWIAGLWLRQLTMRWTIRTIRDTAHSVADEMRNI